MDALDVAGALGVLAGTVLTVWKVVLPVGRWGKSLGRRIGRMLDVVTGTPDIPDPDRPGLLLKAATPDIGVRVTSIEEKLDVTVVRYVVRAEEAATEAHKAAAEAARAAANAQRDAMQALDVVNSLELRMEQHLGVGGGGDGNG